MRFYTVPGEKPGRVELHKYPAAPAADDRVLAFVGEHDLLDFAVTDPSAVPAGTTCDWQSFSLVSRPQGSEKPENLVTYGSDAGGNWVAFKTGDGWTINWRGGES